MTILIGDNYLTKLVFLIFSSYSSKSNTYIFKKMNNNVD